MYKEQLAINKNSFRLFISNNFNLELITIKEAENKDLKQLGLGIAVGRNINEVYGGSVEIKDNEVPKESKFYSIGNPVFFYSYPRSDVAVPIMFYK